jgi:fructokinase
MQTPRVTVAGESLIDLVIAPDGSVVAKLGGAPFNTARAAARLGAPVTFVGAMSTDRFGSMLAAQLDLDGVAVAAGRTDLPTTLAAAELDESGAASYRFYIEGTSAPALVPGDVGVVEPGILFTGGLGLVLQPMADTVLGLIENADASTLVVVDINCRPKIISDRDSYLVLVRRALARADLVKVSDDDLAYLDPGADSIDAARRLLHDGPRVVLVTAGAEGTSIVTSDGVIEVPVGQLAGPVVDTIGAGDTFGGGLVAWWHAAGLGRDGMTHEALVQAVRAAHAAAAVVVTRPGADPPNRTDLPDDWG